MEALAAFVKEFLLPTVIGIGSWLQLERSGFLILTRAYVVNRLSYSLSSIDLNLFRIRRWSVSVLPMGSDISGLN